MGSCSNPTSLVSPLIPIVLSLAYFNLAPFTCNSLSTDVHLSLNIFAGKHLFSTSSFFFSVKSEVSHQPGTRCKVTSHYSFHLRLLPNYIFHNCYNDEKATLTMYSGEPESVSAELVTKELMHDIYNQLALRNRGCEDKG